MGASPTEATLAKAEAELRGVMGELITLLILRKGLRRSTIERWVRKLRKAADILETLT